MKLLRILAALAAIAVPSTAPAQDKAPATEPAASAKLDAENLLIRLPEGFVVGDSAKGEGGLTAAEFIPKDETLDNWTSMVTVQVFRGAKDGPDEFAKQLKTGWEAACSNSKVERLGAGRVNDYRYTVWSFGCPLNPKTNKPETMWLKAIRGNDALYVIQYAFRALPTGALKATADGYLGPVAVCDTRKPKHPCPATK